MDDKISRALQLVEEGKIDEGIRLYEELELIGQTNEQLNKWNTGERVIQAGQTMKNEAQQDLLLMGRVNFVSKSVFMKWVVGTITISVSKLLISW